MLSVADRPDFLACIRIVCESGFGPRAYQLRFAFYLNDIGCGKTLPLIAIPLRFSIAAKVAEFRRAIRLPNGFTCFLVECDQVLKI